MFGYIKSWIRHQLQTHTIQSAYICQQDNISKHAFYCLDDAWLDYSSTHDKRSETELISLLIKQKPQHLSYIYSDILNEIRYSEKDNWTVWKHLINGLASIYQKQLFRDIAELKNNGEKLLWSHLIEENYFHALFEKENDLSLLANLCFDKKNIAFNDIIYQIPEQQRALAEEKLFVFAYGYNNIQAFESVCASPYNHCLSRDVFEKKLHDKQYWEQSYSSSLDSYCFQKEKMRDIFEQYRAYDRLERKLSHSHLSSKRKKI